MNQQIAQNAARMAEMSISEVLKFEILLGELVPEPH